MSVNGDAARRDMWAGRIERCLASGMSVKEWCRLNKVAESSLYSWMARFREEEPDRFPRRSSEASGWIKVTRGGIADAKAIVPAAPAAGSAEAPVTTAPTAPSSVAAGAAPIRALVGRVELAIPAGAAQADIAAAMRAAATL